MKKLAVWGLAALVWGMGVWGGRADTPPVEPPLVQQIYIPYTNLWEVFEREGRGVFIPYEEFMGLWALAERPEIRPADGAPPAGALITEMSAKAILSNDMAVVEAVIRLDALRTGWHEVPLRLGDAAITQALLDDEPARLIRTANQGYALLLNQTNEPPQTRSLQLTFARSITKNPGRNSVSFQTPPAPVSRWDIRIPEAGVEVAITPMVAATESLSEKDARETRLLAFVGATPEVRIEWTPKSEGAKGLQALVHARSEQEMRLDEGISRSRIRMIYQISRAELSELLLEVPADQKIVNVFDQNVREWTAFETNGVQRILVRLFEPAKGEQDVLIELEKYEDGGDVVVPVVRALDVLRQQGLLVVKTGTGLRSEISVREGIVQSDLRSLPPAFSGDSWDFACQYAALPFRLVLAISKVEPRVLVSSLVHARLLPGELSLVMQATYDIQKAGLFRLELQLPPDFELLEVAGSSGNGASPVQIDSHLVQPDGRLVVQLSRQAIGRAGLLLRLRRKLQDAALLAPTGKAALISLAIPRANTAGIEQETGRIAVFAPESLRVNAPETRGLRVISYGDIRESIPAAPPVAGENPVLACSYADDAVALTLSAERRAPHVAVRQLLDLQLKSGVIRYSASFHYDIQFSGVKSLRLDVPADVAAKIRGIRPGIRFQAMEKADPPPPEGYVAWQIEGEGEFIGSCHIPLDWEYPLPELDVGKTLRLSVPRLIPMNADRAWGQIVLAKAEGIDILPTDAASGLRAIDPRYDLMPGASPQNAARAFEFHDAWTLELEATRYEPKEVKTTSIERGLVRMVLTRGDLTTVQALYRVRSAQQRLALRLPEAVQFDTQPVSINGRPVALEQGRPGEYFIPLISQNPDQAFLLELRYSVTGAGLALTAPDFPNDPAIQQVYLSIHLPNDLTYLGATGPWNDELTWMLRGFNAWPRGNQGDDALIRWVMEDVPAINLNAFPTAGRHLLFSSLRPQSGPGHALRITAMRSWMFHLASISLIVLAGLLLLPFPIRVRVATAGLALIALVLSAVFAPSFARAFVNNGTAAAGFVVLIVWALWGLLVTRPAASRLREQPPIPGQNPGNPPASQPEGDDGHA